MVCGSCRNASDKQPTFFPNGFEDQDTGMPGSCTRKNVCFGVKSAMEKTRMEWSRPVTIPTISKRTTIVSEPLIKQTQSHVLRRLTLR